MEKETRVIEAGGVDYPRLNSLVRQAAEEGSRRIILRGVRGQRYLGSRLDYQDLHLQIYGVPGEDLAFNLGGPTVEVFGHAQNAVANTMDSGKVLVHGLVGDAAAYGMRGGKLFIKDNAGYRMGIHMKEYGDKIPVLVIGGSSGDYLGEYMAGGIILLLNRYGLQEEAAGNAARSLATGIHGGKLFIYGAQVPEYRLGAGAKLEEIYPWERAMVEDLTREFCRDFQLDAAPLLKRELLKIVPRDSRPFANIYYPSYPVNTGLKPEHREGVSPCETNCPAGIPTGRFLRYLRLGEKEKALSLVGEYTPLRLSCCGFICPHLCMESCTRGMVDFPVRTEQLARTFKSKVPQGVPDDKGKVSREESGMLPARKERIAVIGAGPAGLGAAYRLALDGYRVTVYDEADKPGGKLYQVVSPRRLPREALEEDLSRLEKLGIEFVLNTRVDGEMMNKILEKYHHVIVAVGAHKPVVPPVKGAEKITGGLDFLKDHHWRKAWGESDTVESPVVIIGGGDAAMDGIEVLLEKGVSPYEITVLDIQKPAASEEERREMERKGVKFRYPVFLQEVNREGVWVENQAGEKEFISARTVLAFINEKPRLDFLPHSLQEALDEKGFFRAGEEGSFRTIHPCISVVGDIQGAGLVTTNLGRGRQCAREVEAIIQGEEFIRENPSPLESPHLIPEKAEPVKEEQIDPEEEQWRCLHCGICVQCDECIEACPRGALSREGENFNVDLNLCGGCGTCAYTCLGGVIRMVPR